MRWHLRNSSSINKSETIKEQAEKTVFKDERKSKIA